jgi:hypothetical protein
MPEVPTGRANRWLTCAQLGHDAESGYRLREAVRLALEAENIESRPVWKPMHMQPVCADAPFVGSGADETLFRPGPVPALGHQDDRSRPGPRVRRGPPNGP